MFGNLLLVTLRNFLRNKYYTAVNLTGLALGLSCGILILLWISDELKFDTFHVNNDRLFRVLENQYYDGLVQTSQATPGILAEALKAEVPEITHAIQMTWEIRELVTFGKESAKEAGRYASPEMLEMFSYPLVTGDIQTALKNNTSIIISQKMASRYFGNENPIGKLILIGNKNEFAVTAVFQDIPMNSSVRFDYVINFDVWRKNNQWAQSWENYGPRTYVMIAENTDPNAVDAKIRDFIKKKLPTATVELSLQRYDESYLYSEFKDGKQNGGRIDYVKSFAVVAIIVLAIACINFMNLATAQSLKRAKEIGIRKVNGAARKILIGQFIGESIMFALLGLGLALIIVELLLPLFRQVTQKEVVLDFRDPWLLASILGITLITGIVSGSYPAFFLSSFNIVSTLKGTLKVGRSTFAMRKALVIFQFCMTIGLIFCALVVYEQIQYIRSKNLGFDRENLVLLPVVSDRSQKITEIEKRLETTIAEMERIPGIRAATVSTTSPIGGGDNTIAVDWPGKSPDEKILFTQMAVGYNYIETMGIEMKDGRDFTYGFRSDTTEYIINEETARRMELADPVGQQITFWGTRGTIIGVMKDYHLNSLHNAIEPVILHLHPAWSNWMIIRIEGPKTTEAIAGLKNIYQALNPTFPFEYQFVDEKFESQYRSEATVGKLANYFSLLAILISSLGLLGLIAFSAEQRTKEIGVRKVLGASVQNILLLLSRDFMLLIMIAFLISAPLSWYVMTNWLKGYAYRIEMGWLIFFISGLTSIAIAFLTISLQALRTAMANPINSLRNE